MGAIIPVVAALTAFLAALVVSRRKGWVSMLIFCCVVSVALFVLAVVLAFDTEHQFVTVQQGNAGPAVAANMVRALAALSFCLGGGCSIVGAALCRRPEARTEPYAVADRGGRR